MRCVLIVLCVAFASIKAKPEPYDTNRIVEGIDVQDGEIPWQVSFQQTRTTLADFHFCGGSVLNEEWIICAAHCVSDSTDFPPSNYQIEGGMISLKAGGQERKVDAIIRNQRYGDNGRYSNDISLVHVAEAFDLNDEKFPMAPVTLPQKMTGATAKDPYIQANFSESYPNTDWTDALKGTVFGVSGWGTIESGQSSPDIMQKVAVSYITDDVCNDPPAPAKPTAGYGGSVFYSMICAGGTGGHHDSCQGDSGGPMNVIKPSDIVVEITR